MKNEVFWLSEVEPFTIFGDETDNVIVIARFDMDIQDASNNDLQTIRIIDASGQREYTLDMVNQICSPAYDMALRENDMYRTLEALYCELKDDNTQHAK